MMNGLLIVIGAWSLATPQSASDEQAIRKAYLLRDRCYATRDAKTLATTELPDYFAISYDKKIFPPDRLKQHIKWRFENQMSCKRTEKPVSIKISGETATVQVKVSDEYTTQDKKKVRTKKTQREEGIARWQRMPEGWRLESFQFTKVEWIDEKGKWQVAPKPSKKKLAL